MTREGCPQLVNGTEQMIESRISTPPEKQEENMEEDTRLRS